MMNSTAIARPYARAAFEHAREEGRLSQWSALLETLRMIVSDVRMRALIHDPRLSRALLLQIVLDICGDRFAKTETNFARILIEAGRLALANEIFELFEAKRAEAENVAEIIVITAYPLAAEQTARIVSAMTAKLGKKVRMVSEVDRSLIGGVIIRAGDAVIDASLRGRLRDLNTLLVN